MTLLFGNRHTRIPNFKHIEIVECSRFGKLSDWDDLVDNSNDVIPAVRRANVVPMGLLLS